MMARIVAVRLVAAVACLLVGLILSRCHTTGQPAGLSGIRAGDLLFQDMDCGPMCEAIEAVTEGWNGRDFSHIGLAVEHGDSLAVIEAIGERVQLTSVKRFLYRSVNEAGNPKIVIGRVKPRYRRLIGPASAYAIQQLGIPYDDDFLYDNKKYYCSEMIYDAFLHANGGKPFFELKPMTFNDPATGKPFSVWQAYYEKKNMAIPEGQPGCNPGGLSVSDKISVVKVLY
jgi:hypothetical protein